MCVGMLVATLQIKMSLGPIQVGHLYVHVQELFSIFDQPIPRSHELLRVCLLETATLLVMVHLPKEPTIMVFSGVGSIMLTAVGRTSGP